MTQKERNQILTMLDEIKALVLLDDRAQATKGQRSPVRHVGNSPEHMARMQEARREKARESKRQKLWAELEKLEAAAPAGGGGAGGGGAG